jgi:hypothetical protein
VLAETAVKAMASATVAADVPNIPKRFVFMERILETTRSRSIGPAAKSGHLRSNTGI